ncbi:MAG TPA: malonyl-CoA synthase [Steroidobacteraceae bacterium]|jgi:malonyl-CoA/methylmalonyl-CoA synthetase|nr:malonyl-CoA synthase [Steroidobacteraceae bacterium]
MSASFNGNLFIALRERFPADMNSAAVRVADPAPGCPAVFSWRGLNEASARIANLLESLDLPPGARVAMQAEKSVEALIVYLAVLRAGYVFLPLNPAYQAAEIEYFLEDAEPSVVVCPDKALERVTALARERDIAHVFSLNEDRTGTLLEAARTHSSRHQHRKVRADDVAVILYTSGTTGRCKGAMLTHGNLLGNTATLHDYWGWRSSDVLIHTLPIFHVHGLFVAAQGALYSGAGMIWFNRFDAQAIVQRLPEATVFMGVPTLYVRMLQESGLTQEACRNMRLFAAGSAALLPDTFNRWRKRTGQTIVERYGMSETVMLTSNPYYAREGERRAGTVGLPLPGVQLRITGGSAKPCRRGEIGGIEVRGPSVFKGYWRAPELTAAAFTPDGWFSTGDLGLIDELGYVVILGRSKDLIISGGYNVYPAEVEGYLNELPGVAESAVIGVPHPDFGEAVVAVIVPEPGAAPDPAALIAELKTRIANFKVPKRMFVVEELPRNLMGKVQKALLRDRHKGLF